MKETWLCNMAIWISWVCPLTVSSQVLHVYTLSYFALFRADCDRRTRIPHARWSGTPLPVCVADAVWKLNWWTFVFSLYPDRDVPTARALFYSRWVCGIVWKWFSTTNRSLIMSWLRLCLLSKMVKRNASEVIRLCVVVRMGFNCERKWSDTPLGFQLWAHL